jgi:hypothetical protein
MGDPGMYTTKRGKNKKSKEAVRKDHTNNQANKINAALQAAMVATADFVPTDRPDFGKAPAKIGVSNSTKARLQARSEMAQIMRAQEAVSAPGSAPAPSGCSYPACKAPPADAAPGVGASGGGGGAGGGPAGTGAPAVRLSSCKSCHRAQYCGVECQRAHWPEHRAACKAVAVLQEALAAAEAREAAAAAAFADGGAAGGAGREEE